MPFSDGWWSLLCFSIGSRLDCKFFSGEGCVLYFNFAGGTKAYTSPWTSRGLPKGFQERFQMECLSQDSCYWLLWWPFGIDFAYKWLSCCFGRSLKCTVQVGKLLLNKQPFPKQVSVDWRTHTRTETIFNISGLFSVHVNTRYLWLTVCLLMPLSPSNYLTDCSAHGVSSWSAYDYFPVEPGEKKEYCQTRVNWMGLHFHV